MGRTTRDEHGGMAIEVTILMGIALLLLIGFANVAVNGYIKGVAHSAADQGVRAGARVDVDSASACEDRARQVMANVLSGPVGAGASVTCSGDGDVVRSTIDLTLPAWVLFVGDDSVTVTGLARKEREPGSGP